MDKKAIEAALGPIIEEQGCFLVDLLISKANDIEIVIEKAEGSVTWDDCEAVDKKFHEIFSQDEEDYSLTVSSAGLDRPLKVLRQFEKAKGSLVDAKLRGGTRIVATLMDADEKGVRLSYTSLEKAEGAKKKVKVTHDELFPWEEVNSVTPYIDFK
ncbi:MAG: hypothetical protein IKR69_01740 [Bacteroidales bacterium]|nr:hypothetical protein [Bacteroidales bacterium]